MATARRTGAVSRACQLLLDSGQFENRAALARYLGVSRARVTQVLSRIRQSAGKRQHSADATAIEFCVAGIRGRGAPNPCHAAPAKDMGSETTAREGQQFGVAASWYN